jgi:hypothetical protein
MRHCVGNVLKDQAYGERIGASPRNPLECDLVTVEELEQRTGETFPEVPEYAKTEKPEHSWMIPIGCNKG